jgi:hypothetical protein
LVETNTMSGKLSSLNRRLAKVEQQVAERTKREELANCICRTLTIVQDAEQFEVEMNRPCPVHGVRDLGQLLIHTPFNSDTTPSEVSIKRRQLLDLYELRLSQHSQSSDELEENES